MRLYLKCLNKVMEFMMWLVTVSVTIIGYVVSAIMMVVLVPVLIVGTFLDVWKQSDPSGGKNGKIKAKDLFPK